MLNDKREYNRKDRDQGEESILQKSNDEMANATKYCDQEERKEDVRNTVTENSEGKATNEVKVDNWYNAKK